MVGVSAVAGALLGARYGLRGIPTRLVKGLSRKDYLTRVGKDLIRKLTDRDEASLQRASLLTHSYAALTLDFQP